MNYSPFKRLLLAAALCLVALTGLAQGKAKYVFYFIGDGMGVNQVNGTETYLAALEGRIGTTPLCFADFPASALVTTYSGTNGVPDSAAAGTALATGPKTKNGARADKVLKVKPDEAMGRVRAAKNFVLALRGKEKPLNTPDQAIKLMKIIDAVYASAKCKAPVKVK